MRPEPSLVLQTMFLCPTTPYVSVKLDSPPFLAARSTARGSVKKTALTPFGSATNKGRDELRGGGNDRAIAFQNWNRRLARYSSLQAAIWNFARRDS